MVTTYCNYCGDKLNRRKSRASGKTYCNASCQMKNQTGEDNPFWKGGKSKLTCEQCESEYMVHQYREKNLVQLCKSCHFKMEYLPVEKQLELLNGSKYKKIFGNELLDEEL